MAHTTLLMSDLYMHDLYAQECYTSHQAALGEMDAALRHLEASLAADPRHVRALVALGALRQVCVCNCLYVYVVHVVGTASVCMHDQHNTPGSGGCGGCCCAVWGSTSSGSCTTRSVEQLRYMCPVVMQT